LHHTPDTRRAFLQLPGLLKRGGQIAIWVYTTKIQRFDFIRSQVYRLLTTRMAKKTLLQFCKIAIPLYYLHRIPVLGAVSRFLVPTNMHPDPNWRWLDTFDWYSPKYQWKHTYPEVLDWFREAGLNEVQALPIPVAVQGKRN
jgi:hypothetical protein